MSFSSTSLQKLLGYLYYALIIIVPLTWVTATSELFEFPKMLLVYAFAVVIAFIWAIRMLIDRQLIWKSTYLDIPLLIFFISQLISTIFSINFHTSLYGYYSRFNGGLFSTIAYFTLYYAAVSNLTKKQAKTFVQMLLLSGILSCLYAFPEHFGHSPSCLKVTGKFDVDCWVQDVQTRVFGTFGQPNWLAAYLISIFFIPITFIIKTFTAPAKTQPKWLVASLYSLVAVLFFSVLLFTKSRSGLAGLALGFVIFWVLSLVSFRKNLKSTLTVFFASSLLLLACYLVAGRGAVTQLDSQLQRIFSHSPNPSSVTNNPATPPAGTQLEVGGTESGTIRRIVWEGAIKLWQKYPLFGSGVETFAYGYYNVRPTAHNQVSEWDFLYNKAHNELLNYLATTGLVGLLAYLTLIFTYTIWTIKKVFSSDREAAEPHILIALLSGFWALMVSNFLGFSTVPVVLLFYLFPALTYLLTLPPNTKSHQSLATSRQSLNISTSQYLLLGGFTLFTVYLLIRVLTMYRADLAFARGKNLVDAGNLAPGITSLQSAVKLIKSEPVYTDELSLGLAQAALSLAQANQKTDAMSYAQQAESLSDYTIAHNKVHLNFWKTRARVFATLAAIDGSYVGQAQQALLQASILAPTDPKIVYNLGLLASQLGDSVAAKKFFQRSLELKPDYGPPQNDLKTLLSIEATLPAKPAK